MSIFIYQIGEFLLKTEASSLAGLKIDLGRKFRGDVYQAAGGIATSFSNPFQTPEPQSVSINGTLVCDGCESVSDQMNLIMSLGGVPYIDIIGYLPNACCGGGPCSVCNGQSSGHAVQWITTTGMITNIERASSLADKGFYPTEALEVRIDLVLDPHWYPINKFGWEVLGGISEAVLTSPLNGLEYYHARLPRQADGRFVFRRKNYLHWYTPYAPQVWSEDFFDPLEFSVSTLQDVVYQYALAPNRRKWSAPPSALYAFGNLPTTGQLRISISSEFSPGKFFDHDSLLDLADLDSLLLDFGLTGLLPGDTVFASSGLYAPGFILRNDLPLLTSGRVLKPEWTYPYEAPGQLIGRNNTIRFPTLVPGAGQVGWLHQNRLR